MTKELKYFILWFFFGLIFAFALSLYFNFPFLPKKKYEEGFLDYLSRFLIFFIPYFFFLFVRLLSIIIHKRRIIKENKKPSVIASVLFFTLFIGYFANVYVNNIAYSNLIEHPDIYEAVTPIKKDYKLVTWKRYDHYIDHNFHKNLGYVEEILLSEEILSFNSDTLAIIERNIIVKDNYLIWKHIFKCYDNTYKNTVLARNDTIFFFIDSIVFDYRKLFFENNYLRFESKPMLHM